LFAWIQQLPFLAGLVPGLTVKGKGQNASEAPAVTAPSENLHIAATQRIVSRHNNRLMALDTVQCR